MLAGRNENTASPNKRLSLGLSEVSGPIWGLHEGRERVKFPLHTSLHIRGGLLRAAPAERVADGEPREAREDQRVLDLELDGLALDTDSRAQSALAVVAALAVRAARARAERHRGARPLAPAAGRHDVAGVRERLRHRRRRALTCVAAGALAVRSRALAAGERAL